MTDVTNEKPTTMSDVTYRLKSICFPSDVTYHSER